MFTDLDVSGATAYYAMAQVPRNGKLDRLVSAPITLEAQVGMALLLSAEKQDSTAPQLDDQGRLDAQDAQLARARHALALGDLHADRPRPIRSWAGSICWPPTLVRPRC